LLVYPIHRDVHRVRHGRLLLVFVWFQMCSREPNSMNLLSWYAFLVLTLSATILHAQSIGTIKHEDGNLRRQTKAENGLIISWVVVPSKVDLSTLSDAEGGRVGQVEIFDEHGQPMVSLNVLRPVEGARSVSIEDVSARRGSPIAVAAVFVSKEGDRIVPAASLMLFDFNGKLLSAYVLSDSREIRKLAIDESSNVWTLTENFEEGDPPTVPMVVEYTADGAPIREVIPRSVLWSHNIPPREGMYSGRITMGCDAGVVWIWLPGSTDLVTISASDGKVTIAQTGLPTREKYKEDPLDVAREPSGSVVGVFREDGDDGKSELAYHAWSPSTKVWSRFKPGQCDGDRLLGIGDAGQIYQGFGERDGDICAFGK
jgi:hypothetical protein